MGQGVGQDITDEMGLGVGQVSMVEISQGKVRTAWLK